MDVVVTHDKQLYIGQKVPSAKYDPPDSIRMTTSIKDFPYRVIMKRNMHSINGHPVNFVIVKDEVRKVKGSTGVEYTVTTSGGTTSCNCPGFTFRRKCKHTG